MGLSCPLMGEDLTADSNQIVARGNDLIRQVVQDMTGQKPPSRLTLIDINAIMVEELRRKASEGFFDGQTLPALDDWEPLRNESVLQNFCCGQSWDDAGERRGMWLLHDTLHCNNRCSELIARAISQHL